MVHGSQNRGSWVSWGPTIIFSEKKSPYLNNLSLDHTYFGGTFAVTIFPNFCISWILFPNKGDENEEKLREWKRHICSYTGIYFWICLDIFVLTLSFISGYIWIYLFLQWVLFPVRKFRIYFDIFVHTLGLILDIFWSILIYLFIVKVDTFVHTLGFISGYICS